jgi:molybdopterin synthase catalytic subunit
MLQLFKGPVPVEKTLAAWYADHRTQNYGAFVNFVGTIRAEGDIEGLSFDIYEPILRDWFERWQQKADKAGAYLCMAHSRGDVGIHESSYIAGVFSPKRRIALEMINEFVEDFKANAPIWKYDLKNGKRIYAKDRSTPMEGAGLLG